MLLTGLGFAAHAADPQTKFQYDQKQGSNSQAARDAYAKAQAHGEAVIAAREKRAGRKLTQREQFNGLDREPMSHHERAEHEAFKPKLAIADNRTQMERAAENLETKTPFDKAYAMQDRNARLLAFAKAAAGVDDDSLEVLAELNAHLETPAVAAALKEVDAIRKNMLWDSSRTASELAALDRVEAQWREPNGDREAGVTMLARVRIQELERHASAVAAQNQRIADAQNALGSLLESAPPVGGDA